MISNELMTRLLAIAEELSEMWTEFSTDFGFGNVTFRFQEPMVKYED